MKKIVWENAFDEKKKRPWLKSNPGLALPAFEQLGPELFSWRDNALFLRLILKVWIRHCSIQVFSRNNLGFWETPHLPLP